MKTEEQKKTDYERTKKWRAANKEKTIEHNRLARKRKADEYENMKKTIEHLKGLLDRYAIFYEGDLC